MKLVDCPACGNPNSPRANTCPSCGDPLTKRKVKEYRTDDDSSFTLLEGALFVGFSATVFYVGEPIWAKLGEGSFWEDVGEPILAKFEGNSFWQDLVEGRLWSSTNCIQGDCRNGRGTEVYADGGKFVGEFRNGQRNGFGSYVAQDGYKFEGMYRNGERHGPGKVYLVDGKTLEAEWKEGELVPLNSGAPAPATSTEPLPRAKPPVSAKTSSTPTVTSSLSGNYRRVDTNTTVLVLDGANSYSCSWADCSGANVVCGVKVAGRVEKDGFLLNIPNSRGGTDPFNFKVVWNGSTKFTATLRGRATGEFERMSYSQARRGSNGACD